MFRLLLPNYVKFHRPEILKLLISDMPKLAIWAVKSQYDTFNFHTQPSLSHFYSIILIYFSLAIVSCNATKTTAVQYNNDKDFRILSALVEDHISGRQEGSRYHEYFFKTIILSDAPVKFDTIWVNNKVLPVYISKETTTVSNQPITFTKGDTIILRASDLINDGNNKMSVLPPVKLEGAALLSYSINTIQKFQQINIITKRELPNLPGGAPQQSNQK
jgi:hypothetical protein